MSNTIEYGDYRGSVEYSAEDDCFYGRVLGMNDLVTFEGRTVDELKSAFCESVDEYIAACKECGKEPERTFKGSFNVRIAPELHREAAILAASEGITLNALVEAAIKQTVRSRQS